MKVKDDYQELLNTRCKQYAHEKRKEIPQEFIKARDFLEKKLKQDSKILDIGCENGDFLSMVKNDYDVLGADKGSEFVAYCNSIGIRARVGDAEENLDFDSNTFDAITLFNTLEHIKMPQYNLAEVNRIIKKNGYLIICVPNGGYILNGLVMSFMPQFAGLTPSFGSFDHCNHFTVYDLKLILGNLNFEIEKIEGSPIRLPYIEFITKRIPLYKVSNIFSPTLLVYARKVDNCKSKEQLIKSPDMKGKWMI